VLFVSNRRIRLEFRAFWGGMMITKSPRRIVLVLFLIALANASPSLAQTDSGRIEGRVSDTQQLALPQAVVELLNAQGSVIRKATGAGDGHYEIDSLAAGAYTVRFSRNSFETQSKGPVAVVDSETTILDAVLQPAQLIQSVTVTASQDDRQTASKSDIPVTALPVTVQTVPLELMQEQASTSIVPVVNNIPGANAWTQYGSLNYFTFRGFSVDHDPGSAVLLNGLRVEGNRADSQINSVESVDVLKGPASNLYGTEDTGGTINIIEKQPQDTPHYEVVLHGSRWDTGGIELGATGPLFSDSLNYRLDTAYMHSDGFRGAGYNRFNLSPKISWRITSRDQLRFFVNWNLDHFDGDAGIPLFPGPTGTTPFTFPQVPITNRYNSPANFEYTDYPIVQAFYEHQFSDNLRVREAAQFQYIGDDYWQSEGLEIDPTSSPVQVLRGSDYFSVYFDHRDRAFLSQTDLVGNFHFIWKHQFVIGYEYDYLYHHTKRSADAENADIPPINLFNPVQTATAITSFPPSSYDGLRNLSNAIYFQDYVRVAPKLDVLFSGRYDGYQHFDFDNDVVNGQEIPSPRQDQFSQRPFTFRVGINSQLTPYFSLYTSYSTSFTAQTSLSTAGNTLKPETGKEFEVGARFNFLQNRFDLNVDYFHIDQDNIDVEMADGVIDQAGEQYAYGLEVLLRGRISQRVNIYASDGYTQTAYNDFTVGDLFSDNIDNLRGFTPGLSPRNTARVWTTYDLPKGFDFSLGGRYVSKRSTDPYDIFWMGGFSTFDAAVRYRRAKMEYSLNFSNILNRKGYLISAIDDTQVYPGPPIDIAGTIRYRF
jgi:iron complex outermembrane receptor protein